MARQATTKKQRELLTFIENFIAGHGYSPSYREIKTGLGYSSVGTVANHIDNLITKGYLVKRESSKRSLEVVGATKDLSVNQAKIAASDEKWLISRIQHMFEQAESEGKPNETKVDELYVMVGALRILGLDGAANSFTERLMALKKKAS